jgi:DNA repair exonuclease SbcCD nuclease subunit
MKRAEKVFEKAQLILMSDVHLRMDTPVCRDEEEFLPAQWNKLQFIKDLQRKHGCPVLCAGDLFHHWKPSPYLLSKTMEHLPANFKTVYGQHDLPQHSLPDQNKSGIFALKTANRLTLLDTAHYGEDPEGSSWEIHIPVLPIGSARVIKILVWHKMNYQGKKPWPGCTDPRAGGLLRKYPEYDLILTGDNHKAFVERHKGRILVNPGSLMRQSADQSDFLPRVYLWYADTNTVEPVYLPIKRGAVSRDHLERSSERSERITAFIESIAEGWEAGLSFEANMEEFFKNNRVRKRTKEICYKALES